MMKETVNPTVSAPTDRDRFPALPFLLGLIGAVLIPTALFILALRSAYDADIGYFVTLKASLLPTLWICATLVLLAGMECFLFLSRRSPFGSVKDALSGESGGLLLRVSECLLACAFLFRSWKQMFPSGIDFSGSGILVAVLSLGAVLYLVFPILRVRGVASRVILGIVWLGWGLVKVITSYTDMYVPMNQPFKLISQFLYFFMMLALISELRYFTGTQKPVRYLAFSVPAFVFSFMLPVGLLLGGRADVFREQIGQQVFLIAYAFFTLCRIVTVVRTAASATPTSGAAETSPTTATETVPDTTSSDEEVSS